MGTTTADFQTARQGKQHLVTLPYIPMLQKENRPNEEEELEVGIISPHTTPSHAALKAAN